MNKTINSTSKFDKDVALCKKRGLNMAKLKHVINLLAAGETLEAKYKNHKLTPKTDNLWDCHIAPDWVLIYTVSATEVTLVRTGTHADLF
jgi:mRNA interferase YafQ